jgi:hypothetical protein
MSCVQLSFLEFDSVQPASLRPAPPHPLKLADSLRPVSCYPAEQPVICETKVEVNLNIQKK